MSLGTLNTLAWSISIKGTNPFSSWLALVSIVVLSSIMSGSVGFFSTIWLVIVLILIPSFSKPVKSILKSDLDTKSSTGNTSGVVTPSATSVKGC